MSLRDRAEKVRRVDPDWKLDWAREAWEAVSARPYTKRTTGTGEPLPSFCLKIPTGGGKTLLATRVIDLVHGKLLYRQTGLVLWIVPTTQIYRQTLAALKDRDHPYASNSTSHPLAGPWCWRRPAASVRPTWQTVCASCC